MRQRIALFSLVGLLLALGFMVFGIESALPERVATHFGADGAPNGWMSREGFATSMLAMVLVPVAFLQGIGLLIGRLPTSLFNLPNRDYWLADERRATTIDHIRMAMFEFGNATFAFLLFVVWSIVDANKDAANAHLGGAFTYGLFAFLAFVAVWLVFLVRPYLKVPEAPGTGLKA